MSTPARSFPKHPSNRALIKQMELWDWVVDKKQGDYLVMRHTLSGVKVTVLRSHIHDGNLSSTFNDIYNVTCNGDANKFWERQPKSDEPAKVTSIQQKQKAMLERDARQPYTGALTQEEEVAEQPKQKRTDKKVSNMVLEKLVEAHGQAVSTAQLAEMLPEVTNDQINGAGWYLNKLGLVERIKTGVYRATPAMLGTNARVAVEHGLTIADIKDKVEAAPAPAPAVDVDTSVWEVKTDAKPVVEQTQFHKVGDVEEEVDAILDMLFPDGIRIVHFGRIQAWRELTMEMVQKVRA